ncbi:MAG: hypothetical protein WC795_01470 [Candidatus Paceibacterota bacterium]|jgi:flagellar basal body-associated protein FliL
MNEPIMQNMNSMPEKKSRGPLVGSIVIIVLLIAGGIYFFMSQKQIMDQNSEATPETDKLDIQSSSDDIDSIDADIKATDMSNLDQGTY